MQSCLYAGSVSHCRTQPFEHRFNYSLFMVYLDLSELSEIFNAIKGWSLDDRALAAFYRCDHLGDPDLELSQSVRHLIQETTTDTDMGSIRLLTHLRYFGHCFNPVSFYYCFDADDRNVKTVVAEVNNTPWHEQHCYVMPVTANDSGDKLHVETNKAFHVSPFLPMDLIYRFALTIPGEELLINIDVDKETQPVFNASMRLNRIPLTQMNAWKSIIKFPAMTMQIVLGIYWQALKLKLKGATYHPHTVKS